MLLRTIRGSSSLLFLGAGLGPEGVVGQAVVAGAGRLAGPAVDSALQDVVHSSALRQQRCMEQRQRRRRWRRQWKQL